MKLKEAEKLVGKTVIYKVEKMRIECLLDAVKSSYGRVLYKLIPRAGSGYKWTSKAPGE
jgi:hypothetical protein